MVSSSENASVRKVTAVVADRKTLIRLESGIDLLGLELTMKAHGGSVAKFESCLPELEIFSSQYGERIRLSLLDTHGKHVIQRGEHDVVKINCQVQILTAAGFDLAAQLTEFQIVPDEDK